MRLLVFVAAICTTLAAANNWRSNSLGYQPVNDLDQHGLVSIEIQTTNRLWSASVTPTEPHGVQTQYRFRPITGRAVKILSEQTGELVATMRRHHPFTSVFKFKLADGRFGVIRPDKSVVLIRQYLIQFHEEDGTSQRECILLAYPMLLHCTFSDIELRHTRQRGKFAGKSNRQDAPVALLLFWMINRSQMR